MSMKAPPTLLQLAGQSLLRNEALAISALQTLPMELFPPLFMEALTRRHTEVVKAMVQAWPFSCLPLGPLMKAGELETLQVALDGIDMLLGQQVCPRRWKLQVLDLRSVHQNFWKVFSGAMVEYCISQTKGKNKALDIPPRTGVKPSLRLIVDLNLELHDQDKLQIHLFEWVQQRKRSIQLCCRKMQIWGLCTCGSRTWPIHRVLGLLELDWMEEVEMNCPLTLYTLATFAPYLGQLRNLRKLRISQIFVLACISPEQYEQLVATFTSQFSKLSCLQQLCVSRAYFLHGHLQQVLRCLKTPLESLSITHCQLAESDLEHLSQCPCIHQLKHLSLRGVPLISVRYEALQVLLERVADTLKTLDLEDCGIRDPQLTALLPALSHCSQLTMFSFFGNHISMSVLKDLLHHTARLCQLSQELYPAPLESYDGLGSVVTERLTQHCAELMDTLRAIRKPKMVLFGTEHCHRCGNRWVYNMEHCLNYCWMHA
ncbi:PRAME family member 12-like [Castor canadensis]|uniref:PRAME family member 12-like n=1 Tax=Castor canadensis TaxID=51338 RepID=UPI003D187189